MATQNELLKDIHTLVDEVVEETDQASGFSKTLPSFGMSDVDGQRQGDVEYVPEDFRFEAADGYKSKSDNSDVQGLVDRLIPIRRTKAVHIKTSISTKGLRDPRLREQASKGFAREIRNKIDIYCYRKAIEHATMMISTPDEITQKDTSAAEVLMLDNGLGQYRKNLFLSLSHYKSISDKLAANQYHQGVPETAYKRSEIPNMIGGFDKAFRADYRLNLPASAATGITVTGEQSHTVTTMDANETYIDNRSMKLNVSDGSLLAPGDKFTIAGINRLNPEVREDTGELMTFTVIATLNNVPTICPSIVVTGPYRNCTAPAADGAEIVPLNIMANSPSIFWADDSIRIIPGNLPVAGGGVEKVEASTDQGIPFRFTYWYDTNSEEFLMKAVCFFDLAVWLPNQTGIIIDKQR